MTTTVESKYQHLPDNVEDKDYDLNTSDSKFGISRYSFGEKLLRALIMGLAIYGTLDLAIVVWTSLLPGVSKPSEGVGSRGAHQRRKL